MVVVDYQMDAIETKNNQAIIERLKTDGYVNEDNTLNVEKLMGRKMQTGNGSIETGDVYVLEQRQETASSITSNTTSDLDYYLIYYNDEKTDTNLGLAFENATAESIPAYYVEGIIGLAELQDIDDNVVEFEEAYIIYEGERIDVTDCIVSYEDGDFGVNLWDVAKKLEKIEKIEDVYDINGTTQTFEIVKDGKSYFGDVTMIWPV